MIETTGPNAQQIQYWNEVSGPKWVRLDDTISGMIRPFGIDAIASANPVPGERVLDVGCGCGETSIALARAVSPGGDVTGIDLSSPMLAQARLARARADVANVEFLNADAQTEEFAQDAYDLVFSRFGVMFFANPEAAFANLRRSLRSGGRLGFACWQSREKNPWMFIPAAAAAKHVEMPPPPPPGAPGPLSLCDPDKTVDMLERAGYRNIMCRASERKIDVSVGSSLQDTVSFLSQMGPAGSLLQAAPLEIQRAAQRSISEALLPHQNSSGIELDAAVWIVTATRD